MKTFKILGSTWWTPPVAAGRIVMGGDLIIGVVAIESFTDGSWKAYIGYGGGEDEQRDQQRIASYGMPIGNKEAACGFFPHLTPSKFKF